jgi:prevent-host-death family protein
VLDEVARTGESVMITKRGRPVTQLVPVRPANLRHPQDGLRGTVEVVGDIVAPPLGTDAWKVVRERRG